MRKKMEDEMQRMFTLLMGVMLVACGLFALAANAVLPVIGFSVSWLAPWRFWPLIVLGVGAMLLLFALMSFRRPALGALFIPAVPVSVVGLILLYASLFDQWRVWESAWALVVLAVAAGFVLAMAFARSIWFGIPAIVIGLNGLVLAFCAVTGLWSWWSVLWTVEPLAVGLILLLVAYKTRSGVVGLVGLSACAFAAFAFSVMSGLVLFGGWAFRLMGPAMLVLFGVILLGWGLVRRPAVPAGQDPVG
jgi:hypothetical protein